MIALRLAVLAVTGLLSTAALILAVVALLAAQWLLVAGATVLVMALGWAALKAIALIGRRSSEAASRGTG